MMKKGLMTQIMSWKDRFQIEKRKSLALMKVNLCTKIIEQVIHNQEQNHTVIQQMATRNIKTAKVTKMCNKEKT